MWEAWLSRSRPSAILVGFLLMTALVADARGDELKLSISGYDPVAYFTEGKPVQGKTEFEYLWHKSRWRFVNSQHRDLFTQDPEHYAPQYDGYCAMGVAWSDPHKDTVDPEAWAIVDGKLYLTHTPSSLEAWSQSAAENIKTANQNWSTVKSQPEPVIVGSPCPSNPPSVVITLSGGGRQLLVGAQLARDADGNIVGKGDMRAQIEQVGKNIQACLEAAGTNKSNIILAKPYVIDTAAFSKNADVLASFLGPGSPSSTVSAVPKLSAGPDFLVEIEAVANLGTAAAPNADHQR